MATLYHHWLNPACRFARLLLAEKGVEHALKLEKEWERRPAFLRLNPAGEVPVLVLEDGRVLSGMVALAEFLEDWRPDPALLIGDMDQRFEIRRLVGWFHTKFGTEVTRILLLEKLYKMHFGMGDVDSGALRAASYNLRIHMKYVEYLTEEASYLAGDRFTMADAAAAAHISVVDYFGLITWDDFIGARDWYQRIKSRRSMQGLLSDRIGGLRPPAHYGDVEF